MQKKKTKTTNQKWNHRRRYTVQCFFGGCSMLFSLQFFAIFTNSNNLRLFFHSVDSLSFLTFTFPIRSIKTPHFRLKFPQLRNQNWDMLSQMNNFNFFHGQKLNEGLYNFWELNIKFWVIYIDGEWSFSPLTMFWWSQSLRSVTGISLHIIWIWTMISNHSFLVSVPE